MRILGFSILMALVICGSVMAQSGETSFEFLLIGTGARAAAMGEAFTAVSGDVGAPYFNPASAAFLNNTELSFMHISYLTDASLDNFSILSGKNKYHYGLSLYYGKVTDIERRDIVPTDQPLGTFDEHNFTASMLFAMQATERLAFGGNLKGAYEKLDLSSASAIGLDLGVFYSFKPRVAFGASLRNLGTRPKFESTPFDLPRELRLGVSYRTQSVNKSGGLVLGTDYIVTNWGNKENKLNIGGEYTYQNLVSFRAGYDFGYDTRNISIGGGITYRNYIFDYAFVPSKNNLSDTHRFTLRIKI